jgi:signal transduction histidine kinase
MTTRLRPSRIGPLPEGGFAGALLRSRDWSATDLGPLETWPRALRLALRLAFRSRGPAAVLWGTGPRVFYNDAWVPLEGERHPRAFGAAPAGGLWTALTPAVRRAFGDEAGGVADVPWGGRRYDFAFTPLGSEPEEVDGLYCSAVDQTRRGRAERRLEILREINAEGPDARAVKLLADELGFAWLYRVESDGETASLSAAAGGAPPKTIRISRPPAGPRDARAFPLVAPGERRPSGLLVAGAADAETRDWLELVARLLAGPRDAESLAYTVAHDLRAPVRAMTSFSDALLEEETLSEEGRGLARRIAGAGRRADALIRDLLDYSHLSRERIELKEIDLETLIADTLADLEETLRERRAEVEILGPLPPARGHRPSLRRALENLISNAVKFTAPGVSPRVRIRREGRRLWVEDNGIGIAADMKDKLFKPFSRLHPSGGPYPGVGVGLAVTRKAIERMGGRVGLESEPGRGSRFWIELPSA